MGRILISIMILGAALLCGVLFFTNPSDVGPLGILLVFIAGYMIFLGFMTYVLYYCSRLIRVVGKVVFPGRRYGVISLARAYYFSTVLALLPMMLISLYSVGRVSIYELLLLVAFGVIGILYVSKRT